LPERYVVDAIPFHTRHTDGGGQIVRNGAIDLKDGKCVRLKQGRMDDATDYGDNPAEMGAYWQSLGAKRLHVVDSVNMSTKH